jgi:hypothetical protein
VSIRGVEQNLWRDIVGRATDGLLPLARTFDKSSQTKVADFSVHVRMKEKVAELEVTVDDLVGVHIVASTNELNHEELSLWLCKDATVVKHIHERATR